MRLPPPAANNNIAILVLLSLESAEDELSIGGLWFFPSKGQIEN
ncbi:MAG: hypothetical protein R8L53_04880 [Mariprofundales bacterium]